MSDKYAVADKEVLSAFVKGCAEYQKNSARLDALNEERGALITANGELRKAIVPVFKTLSAHSWDTIKKDIKTSIVEAGIKDVNGLLGVLKTSFEYKILPTGQNDDRLRKAEKWTAWSGVIVPNTYEGKHAPKEEVPPITEPTAPTAQTAETVAPSIPAPTKGKPSVKGTPEGPARPNLNLSHSEHSNLSPSELWVQLTTQYLNCKLTLIAFEGIEAKYKIPKGELLAEMIKARTTVADTVKPKA